MAFLGLNTNCCLLGVCGSDLFAPAKGEPRGVFWPFALPGFLCNGDRGELKELELAVGLSKTSGGLLTSHACNKCSADVLLFPRCRLQNAELGEPKLELPDGLSAGLKLESTPVLIDAWECEGLVRCGGWNM